MGDPFIKVMIAEARGDVSNSKYYVRFHKIWFFEVSLTFEFVKMAGSLQLSTLFQYCLVQMVLNLYQKQTKVNILSFRGFWALSFSELSYCWLPDDVVLKHPLFPTNQWCFCCWFPVWNKILHTIGGSSCC